MTTPLNSLLQLNLGNTIHEEAFREVIEQHLEYFKNAGFVTEVDVPPEKAIEWDGNFYGLCMDLFDRSEIPNFWIHLRATGLFSPTEFTGDMFTIYRVSQAAIDTLKTQYTMVHRSA